MCDTKEDSDTIRTVLKSGSKNKDEIINLITSRTNQQRIQIRESYKSIYGIDLFSDFKSDLSGHFRDVCMAMFYSRADYDCLCLREAMKGAGTNEDTLMEIIATRSASELKEIVNRYPIIIDKRNLLDDIKEETSGNFGELLLALLQGNRSDNKKPNEEQCEKWAKELYEAGENKKGTDANVFIKIFSTRSYSELTCISKLYHKLTTHTILQAINSEFSGDIKKLLITIVYAIMSPSEYFANRINKAIKGIGTNDDLLIRVMVTRAEIDMDKIKKYYKLLYDNEMVDDIKGDTSGDYSKILVKLAGC